MPPGEAEEGESGLGHVGIRGEGVVDGTAHGTVRLEHAGVTDPAVVPRRRPGVARLAGGLVEPALPAGGAHPRHRPVAVLALHREGPVGGHGPSHRAPQAFRRRAGMAAVAGGPVVLVPEGAAGLRVGHPRVKGMDHLREGRDPVDAVAGQGVRRVAVGTEDRAAAAGHGRPEAARVVPVRGEGVGVVRVPQVTVVVEAEDVQPVVPLPVRRPLPAGRGPGRRGRAGGVAGGAVHLVGDRENHVEGRQHLPRGVAGRQPHQRVGILPSLVVPGRQRDPFGHVPPCVRVPVHGPGLVSRPGHGGSLEPLVHRGAGPEQVLDVVPEVGLARGGGVDRTARVRDRLPGDGDPETRRIFHQAAPVVDELGVDGVVRGQDGERPVAGVHAVHAEVVPAEERPLPATGGPREEAGKGEGEGHEQEGSGADSSDHGGASFLLPGGAVGKAGGGRRRPGPGPSVRRRNGEPGGSPGGYY